MQSKTFPTQGGRWPGGPDEGTLLNRKHIQRTKTRPRRLIAAWTGLTLLYCLHVEPEQDDVAVLDVPNGTRPVGDPMISLLSGRSESARTNSRCAAN